MWIIKEVDAENEKDYNCNAVLSNDLHLFVFGFTENYRKDKRYKGNEKMMRYSFDLLMEYKVWQDKEIEKAGRLWQDYDRLFTKVDGSPIHPDTVGDWWNKFQKKYGLEHHNLHSLRHTNASLLISCNTDVVTVSGRLGHSNPNTTLKVYSHMFQTRDAIAANNMAAFANQAKNAS